MVAMGWKNGECIVASRMSPTAIKTAIAHMERELRNVSAQTAQRLGPDQDRDGRIRTMMNYSNFTDKGLQLMHDAVHKAIASDSKAIKRVSRPHAELTRQKTGVTTQRALRTRWLAETSHLFLSVLRLLWLWLAVLLEPPRGGGYLLPTLLHLPGLMGVKGCLLFPQLCQLLGEITSTGERWNSRRFLTLTDCSPRLNAKLGKPACRELF